MHPMAPCDIETWLADPDLYVVTMYNKDCILHGLGLTELHEVSGPTPAAASMPFNRRKPS